MRTFATVAALAATLAWTGTAGAQEFAVGVHGGLAAPMSDYAAKSGPDGGGALDGFNFGVDAWYPLDGLAAGLSWYSSIDIVRNITEGSADRTGGFADGAFLNVPVMTGLRYDLAQDLPRAFVTAQVGLLLTRGPDHFYPFGYPGDPTMGVGFGYNAGVGIQLSDTFHVAARYFPLGTVDYEYDGADEALEQNVSFVDIQIGMRVF